MKVLYMFNLNQKSPKPELISSSLNLYSIHLQTFLPRFSLFIQRRKCRLSQTKFIYS